MWIGDRNHSRAETVGCWLFAEFFRNTWSSLAIQGRGAFVFKEKLKMLKQKIKQWDKDNVGDLDKRCKDLVVTMNQLDIKEEGEGLSREELILRSSTLEEF